MLCFKTTDKERYVTWNKYLKEYPSGADFAPPAVSLGVYLLLGRFKVCLQGWLMIYSCLVQGFFSFFDLLKLFKDAQGLFWAALSDLIQALLKWLIQGWFRVSFDFIQDWVNLGLLKGFLVCLEPRVLFYCKDSDTASQSESVQDTVQK